jgi:hypothetical protein
MCISDQILILVRMKVKIVGKSYLTGLFQQALVQASAAAALQQIGKSDGVTGKPRGPSN